MGDLRGHGIQRFKPYNLIYSPCSRLTESNRNLNWAWYNHILVVGRVMFHLTTSARTHGIHQLLLLLSHGAGAAKVSAMNLLRTISTTQTQTPTPTRLFSPHSPPQFRSQQQGFIATMIKDSNLDSIFEQKRAVRSKVRKDLKGMDPTQRSQEDAAIQNIVLESSWFKSSERLCAYITCSALREVDTSKILSEILCEQKIEGCAHIRKKLYVPRVEDKNSYMRMLNISSTEDLIANSMSILEPNPVDRDGNQREEVMDASDPVDLVLVPGLAFDKSGRRLGRSGGYYDTFFKKYQELSVERKWKQPLLVALSYNLQILDDGVIPVTHLDIPVDALVSPSGIIPISPAAKERM